MIIRRAKFWPVIIASFSTILLEMGKGQRHSKNAGVMGSEGLTYHEKRALGFGTVRERVGKVRLAISSLFTVLASVLTGVAGELL